MPTTKEFTGPPLVAGSVLGFRHFDLLPGPTLGSVIHDYQWGPGMNTGRCIFAAERRWDHKSKRTVDWYGHRAGKQDCTCGYYAYYHPWRSSYASSTRAFGVIEGFGRVSMGPLGFRAEKAKLVAVCLPLTAGARVRPFFPVLLMVAIIAWGMTTGDPFVAMFINGPLAVISGVRLGRYVTADKAHVLARLSRRTLIHELQTRYPESKVYRSRVLMMWRYRAWRRQVLS